MTEVIIRNSIRCDLCHSEIQSTHRHDFRGCECGKTCVDGGFDYLRRIGSSWTDTSIVEEIASPNANDIRERRQAADLRNKEQGQ
ncbi:MAG: hypothetical protein ABS76_26575 [Pelagibacterium sp. SCN 64-44]|nr:MAG: hypothetical protein ABS76_26575 [Pelagibacterium sp. SCN 64-44]